MYTVYVHGNSIIEFQANLSNMVAEGYAPVGRVRVITVSTPEGDSGVEILFEQELEKV